MQITHEHALLLSQSYLGPHLKIQQMPNSQAPTNAQFTSSNKCPIHKTQQMPQSQKENP